MKMPPSLSGAVSAYDGVFQAPQSACARAGRGVKPDGVIVPQNSGTDWRLQVKMFLLGSAVSSHPPWDYHAP